MELFVCFWTKVCRLVSASLEDRVWASSGPGQGPWGRGSVCWGLGLLGKGPRRRESMWICVGALSVRLWWQVGIGLPSCPATFWCPRRASHCSLSLFAFLHSLTWQPSGAAPRYGHLLLFPSPQAPGLQVPLPAFPPPGRGRIACRLGTAAHGMSHGMLSSQGLALRSIISCRHSPVPISAVPEGIKCPGSEPLDVFRKRSPMNLSPVGSHGPQAGSDGRPWDVRLQPGP